MRAVVLSSELVARESADRPGCNIVLTSSIDYLTEGGFVPPQEIYLTRHQIRTLYEKFVSGSPEGL